MDQHRALTRHDADDASLMGRAVVVATGPRTELGRIGTALGEILSRTGAAKFLADQLLTLADGGGPTTVGVFVAVAYCVVVSEAATYGKLRNLPPPALTKLVKMLSSWLKYNRRTLLN
mgnify:CR=1 FL=1